MTRKQKLEQIRKERENRRYILTSYIISYCDNSQELNYVWEQGDLEDILCFIDSEIHDYNIGLDHCIQLDRLSPKTCIADSYFIKCIEDLELNETCEDDILESCGCSDGLRFVVKRVR